MQKYISTSRLWKEQGRFSEATAEHVREKIIHLVKQYPAEARVKQQVVQALVRHNI
jgi:hypothetical protein